MTEAVLLLLPWLAAAAADPAGVRLNVPFFSDRGDQCGPASLAGVLRFWGTPAEPAALKDEIYSARLKGSLSVDLLLAARARGFSAEMLEGGVARLKEELKAGHPVIAFLNVGWSFYPIGHYVVVTGYDDTRGGIYAHSGAERDRFMSYARFDKRWRGMQRWGLLILPGAR